MNLNKISRRRYTQGSTPIEFLPSLTRELGGPRIHIKRDDLLGLTAGGNKTRKLEFLMADALKSRADTIITTGAVQSNHCRLTLSAAVKEGLKCQLLIEERVPGSYREDASGNNLLFRLLGAELITPVPGGTDLMARMQVMAAAVIADGGTPYIIPGGGSNPLGALGYAACAQEILSQTFEAGLDIDHVVCASGSGGTHAGLIAGFCSAQSGITITGISVRAEQAAQETKILDLARQTASLGGALAEVRADQVSVRDEFVGPGYSLPTREMTDAIQLFARTEGILLDPVYMGKTAAGLVGMIREGHFAADSDVLLVHTGGSPAIYAYPNEVLG